MWLFINTGFVNEINFIKHHVCYIWTPSMSLAWSFEETLRQSNILHCDGVNAWMCKVPFACNPRLITCGIVLGTIEMQSMIGHTDKHKLQPVGEVFELKQSLSAVKWTYQCSRQLHAANEFSGQTKLLDSRNRHMSCNIFHS